MQHIVGRAWARQCGGRIRLLPPEINWVHRNRCQLLITVSALRARMSILDIHVLSTKAKHPPPPPPSPPPFGKITVGKSSWDFSWIPCSHSHADITCAWIRPFSLLKGLIYSWTTESVVMIQLADLVISNAVTSLPSGGNTPAFCW